MGKNTYEVLHFNYKAKAASVSVPTLWYLSIKEILYDPKYIL
jgi:hypothetical protein